MIAQDIGNVPPILCPCWPIAELNRARYGHVAGLIDSAHTHMHNACNMTALKRINGWRNKNFWTAVSMFACNFLLESGID